MSFKTKIFGFLRLFHKETKIYLPLGKKWDIVIYDDYFPNPVTGFRVDEFSYLLNKFSNLCVLVDPSAHITYDLDAGLNKWKKYIEEFKSKIAIGDTNKIRLATKINLINTRLLYVVFYSNAMRILKFIEIFKIPFVLQLYPGGGLVFGDNLVNTQLSRVLKSPLCKAVIVNQRVTKNYLIEFDLCSIEKIKLISGLPIAKEKLMFDLDSRKYYGVSKSALNICFVASKYSPTGVDKGYDIFIDVAKRLHQKFNFIRFHVIGGFGPTDIEVLELGSSIKFYGMIDSQKLRQYLSDTDIIITPNRANVLARGAFDGFPVGCNVEASLVGCMIITTDPLKENLEYNEGEEIVIVNSDTNEIVELCTTLINSPKSISSIAKRGTERTRIIYSSSKQLDGRYEILNNILNNCK